MGLALLRISGFSVSATGGLLTISGAGMGPISSGRQVPITTSAMPGPTRWVITPWW